ncbi:sensor histidine kinase [Tumebacillus flagellatus]|uniref:histidine kinase n=1 Tax=Tumebacillus flagellatus TaxID=1157490 RepID=A0A074MGN4_9BACL|nr:sensor histidine kinase [Tumebacillus flagellatus]KEO84887.1 hypothetical protein EL26_02430 [Tumebacillus flagellatus]
MSKDFFLNVMIVLFPVLIFQVFYNNPLQKLTRRHTWWVGILYGISALLCLRYPYIDGYGFYWDLRAIPLTLSLLYGGFLSASLSLGIEMSFRLWVGGQSAWFSILFQLAMLLLLLPFVRKFYSFRPRQRLAVVVGFTMVEYLIFLVRLSYEINLFAHLSYRAEAAKNWLFLILYGLLQAAVMAVAAWLLENMISTTRMRDEVKRSEQLRVISDLAPSIAHEVRHPLTVVRRCLQLVRGNLDDQNQKNDLNTALAELDRAEFIISDYLNFATPHAESMTVLDAAPVLHDVVTLMKPYAQQRGLKLQAHIDPPLRVCADSDKLKQAVINLLKNAVEASARSGGTVTLQARVEQSSVCVRVLDTGIGMTEDQVKQLGQPFYSTKKQGGGLGLMVTFRIVEKMSGELSFQSTPGVGTEATIRLPVADD